MKKLCLIMSLLLISSCTCPIQAPAEKVADVILPEYLNYVESDSRITDVSKQRRIDAVKSFIEAVNSGRR